MKGYSKNLKNFMDYVFKKYKKDTTIQQFKAVYEEKQIENEKNRERRKELLKIKVQNHKVVISCDVANLCISLVNYEVDKSKHLNCYTGEYLDLLGTAIIELYGNARK